VAAHSSLWFLFAWYSAAFSMMFSMIDAVEKSSIMPQHCLNAFPAEVSVATTTHEAQAVSRPTVSAVIEKLPLSKTHYMLAIAAALGYMFDAFDTYIVSFAMPASFMNS
jgi:hypothetical protein